MATHLFKTIGHQVEMFGFFVCRFDPVVKEPHGHRHMGKPRDDVPVQVDRVQFDMGDGVQQGDAPLGAAGFAVGHIAGRQQFGARGAGGLHRRAGGAHFGRLTRCARGLPLRGQLARQRGFFTAIATAQHGVGHLGQRHHRGVGHRAFTASRTSSAWPGTLTRGQMRAMVPSAAISTVVRSIPKKVLPYICFSFHTP